jgi:hypothetical protein
MSPRSLFLVCALLVPALASAQENRPRVREIDVVLALDTSSSMGPLIDATRARLWDVVTMLGKAQPRPVLRVGIVSYGNRSYDRAAGWVRTDVDLTTDLDVVYARLFALRTGGSEEYVARAVQVATRQLSWSSAQDALRIVFVAGNESATQDPHVRLEDALAEARQRSIFVNSIYCGEARKGEGNGWARLAMLGKGQFATIEHPRAIAIATPHDDELRRLGAELNKTYLPYGKAGGAGLANQAAQDRNAGGVSSTVAATRTLAKAGPLYRADNWDLVDATASGKVDVRSMSAASVPPSIATLAPEARAQAIEEKARERRELQRQIAKVGAERERYLAATSPPAAAAPAPEAPRAHASARSLTGSPAKPKRAEPANAYQDPFVSGTKSTAEKAGFSF